MKRFQKFVALVLSLSPVGVLTACGGSGSGGGNSQNPTVGTITLISVAPSPILGCAPVPYTISGTNFETVTGTTARVTWRALGGQTPFLHGTSDHVTTIANVTSDTTIDGLSPDALLCGVPSVTVELDVTLESGVTASSTGIFTVVINAPTIVSIAPNPLPAAIATPFVITGTGFPAAGGPVTIRFTGDAGALLFNDGTHNYVDVQGLVTSTTTIAATSPIATVCGVDAVNLAQLGASIQLFFPDGCCTLPTAPGFVNFVAPAILSLAPNSIPAELPPANVVLNGTNFGPPNTVATVRLVADNNVALFNDGTLNSIDVPGLIGPGSNTVTFMAPTADVCGVASRTATLRVIAPYGSSCRQSSPAFVTFTAPVITTVNGLAQATVPASIPTAIAIQGTGFGPANGVVAVTFISDPAGPPIFGDGTQIESAPVQGVINGAGTQITVTTPHATVQGAASRLASVRISYQGGSCASSPAQFIQFTAATLTGIAATAPTAGTFFAAVPSSFTLSGTNFGPVGSEAFVRFTADSGATPFGNGTQNAFEVPGTVTAVGTITGVAPLAALCPQTTLTATVRVLFQDGGQTSNTAALTFTAPTIAFAPATFAGSVANAFTITGTGFGPANSLVAVKFTAVGGATPFGDGTMNETTVTGTINGAGTQITGLTPLAALCGVASITATVTTTFQGGACASTAVGAVTITAPTINAGGFAPSPVPAATPTAFTITGTGFGTNGQLAQVAFSVTPPAVPFNNGSSSEAIVTGTVGGGGTTITGFTPAVAACPNNVVADVRVTLQNGACTAISSGLVTFLAPTVTTNSLTLPLVSLQNPGLFTITGTNFGPIGGQALVRWTANSAIFADGTNTAHDAPGTITSATTITTNLPVGRLCTTNATASVRVILPMGACGDSPAAFVTWTAPVLTTTAPASTPAYAPAAISITGTTFPAVGTPVAVTFSGGGQVWNNGTSTSVTVLGTVNPANTVTVTPPAAYACATVTVTPTLQFGATNGVSGGCAQTAPTFTMNVPATTAINPASVSALSPSAISLTGTNFPAAGTTVQVRLLATAPAGATPFAGGTQSQIVIPATVNPANTITFTPPVCCITANTTVSTNLTFQNANCEIAGLSFTLNAPTITTVTPATEATLAPVTPVVINGTNFPTAGTPVQVTFSGGGSVWNGATSPQTTVTGTVTTSGTVITVTTPPVASSCVTFTPTVTVVFPAASASGCPLSANGPQYVAPALTAFTTSGTGGGAGIARQTLPNAFTITSTGFTPLGAPVVVRFTNTGGATTPFQGGTSDTVDVAGTIATATTITGVTPLAVATTSFTASVQVFLPNGAVCSVSFSPITFNAPPVVTNVATNLLVREFGAAPANRSFLTNTETFMTITGTGFSATSVALVYKQAGGPVSPIGTGALTSPTVTGSTTIAGGSPLDSTIVTDEQAAVRVTNPDGQSATFTATGFVYRTRGHLQNTNVSLQSGLNSEMEATINPVNPRNMATLSHGTNAPGDVRFAYTTDAGRTWTQTNIGNAQDGLSAAQDRIDPRCAFDRFGNLYLAYFTRGPAPARTMIVLQSFDGGATFPVANRQTVVVNAATDKEFLVTGVNGANPAQEAIYVGWDDGVTSGIIVSGATCAGAGVAQSAYSAPVQVVDAPLTTATQYSNACVGPNGDLHVVWINLTTEPVGGEGPVTIQYDRDPLGLFAGAGFGADITVGTTNFGSFDAIPATPNRQTYAMPEVAVVLTGPSAGRVCITYGTENPDESNDADISCRFTDNGGVTFSPVIDLNDDGTATAQWQASVRADRATGTLVSAWYDSRNDVVNNRRIEIFGSMSYDGGMTWQPNMRISDGQSDQSTLANANEFLDYQGLAIFNGMAFVAWADNSNSTGDNPNGVTQTENVVSRFQFR